MFGWNQNVLCYGTKYFGLVFNSGDLEPYLSKLTTCKMIDKVKVAKGSSLFKLFCQKSCINLQTAAKNNKC